MKTSREQIMDIVLALPKLGQRQDSTADQLLDIMMVANRLGCYDAADVIRNILEPLRNDRL